MPEYMDAIAKFSELLRSGRSLSGRERNCVYLNTGGPRFANVSEVSGLSFEDDGRSICATDWDHDGDLDLWLGNRTAPRLRLMRNESSSGRHLALLLEGRTCNRNAIGARVRVQISNEVDRELIRTVRSGGSFLSQSSRWLFFGVGQAKRIAKISVQWPDGKEDVFTDLPTGRQYHLVQGDAPIVWTRPQPASALKSSPQVVDKPTGLVRVIMAARMPMIHVPVVQFDGQTTIIGGSTSAPVLINLWASWCTPCIAELKQFTDHRQSIEEVGLRIIAASVDGLDPSHPTTAADARQMISDLGFPFESGMLDKDTVERLEFFHSRQFIRNVPLPVPTSFLIDRFGRLAAAYRGPVEIEQLLEDVRALDTPDSTLHTVAVPMPGRWYLSPQGIDIPKMILVLQKRGLVGDAVAMFQDYTRLLTEYAQGPPKTDIYGQVLNNVGILMRDAGEFDRAEQYLRDAVTLLDDKIRPLENLADLLLKNKRYAEALPIFEQLAQLDPNQGMRQQAIASVYVRLGQSDQAAYHYREALKLDPTLAESHNNLGMYLGMKGDSDQALKHFRLAVQHDPNTYLHQYNLGAQLARSGQFAEAAKHLEKALLLNPQSLQLTFRLAWMIASCPEEGLPAPTRAVELAEQLVQNVSPPQAPIFDLLAMAYARNGQFDKAIQAANKAIELARAGDQQNQVQAISDRLRLYRSNQPYLE
jgi:tetratricopeptide (TPR) repeat protein/thiol-disulfide isomerase/thioredoxin